jgi:hypothetical protein
MNQEDNSYYINNSSALDHIGSRAQNHAADYNQTKSVDSQSKRKAVNDSKSSYYLPHLESHSTLDQHSIHSKSNE